MASEAQMIGYELIKTGSLVSFRIVEEELLAAPDEAEFGMRLLLRFAAAAGEGEDDQDEDDVAETPPSGVLSDSCLSWACCLLPRRDPVICHP